MLDTQREKAKPGGMGEVNLGSAHSQEGWVKTSQQRGRKPVVGMVELCPAELPAFGSQD